MRIAQLMAGAANGGAELFFERFNAALHRAGDEVLPIIRANPPRAARLRAAGLAPAQAYFGGALDFWTRPLLARRLRRFAPDAVIAWMGRAARHAPTGPWTLIGRLGGYYDLRQFAHCDHLAGNTQGMVDWIRAQKQFPPDRVHLLPNFVPDLAGHPPAALNLPENSKAVLAMGRLHRNKGFDLLLGAIARLPPHIHAVIAGDGPERDALMRLARHAGIAKRVHFLGWREDTGALLAACNVLACPSRIEPLGNVVLEAFSAGRPVVAAMVGGPAELIESGRTGILVAAESAIALAAGIEGALAQPARMAEAARKRFEQNFSEPAVITSWQSFLANSRPREKS